MKEKIMYIVLVSLGLAISVSMIMDAYNSGRKQQGKDFKAFTVHTTDGDLSTVVYESDSSIVSITEHNFLYSVIVQPTAGLLLPRYTMYEQRIDENQRSMSELNAHELLTLVQFFEHPTREVNMNEVYNTILISLQPNDSSYYKTYPIGNAGFPGDKKPDYVFTMQ